MTLEVGLVSKLGGLVDGRIYAGIAPRKAVSPFITYQTVSTEQLGRVLDPTIRPHERRRVQISIWARDSAHGNETNVEYADVVTLRDSVVAALDRVQGAYGNADVMEARFEDERDLPESEGTPHWRRVLDFTFIVRRP